MPPQPGGSPDGSCPPGEIDHDRDSGEVEPVAQAVLDPVTVVPGQEPRVVHEDPETRGTNGHLRAVEQVQPPAVARRARALRAKVLEEAVELCRGHARS